MLPDLSSLNCSQGWHNRPQNLEETPGYWPDSLKKKKKEKKWHPALPKKGNNSNGTSDWCAGAFEDRIAVSMSSCVRGTLTAMDERSLQPASRLDSLPLLIEQPDAMTRYLEGKGPDH
jgi:hypothetical protein